MLASTTRLIRTSSPPPRKRIRQRRRVFKGEDMTYPFHGVSPPSHRERPMPSRATAGGTWRVSSRDLATSALRGNARTTAHSRWHASGPSAATRATAVGSVEQAAAPEDGMAVLDAVAAAADGHLPEP